MIVSLEKRRWLAFVFVVLITVEIFFISSLVGGTGTTPGSPWPARTYHFTAFFLFAFFLFILVKGNRRMTIAQFVFVLFFSVFHSFLDEFHQYFVPGRGSSFGDVMTDSLGVFLALIIYFYIEKNRN